MAKTKVAVTKPARATRPAKSVKPDRPARPATPARRATSATKTTATKAAATKAAATKAAATKAAARPIEPARTAARPRPTVAAKPKRPTAPSLPLPPPPPPAPAARDELSAPRDVGRLLRYGEQFGAHRIDVRMLPLQLPASSGALAVLDPGAPRSWRVFDRPVGGGQFRVMLSVARTGDKERLAAIVIHVGRPPIARWTVAHYRGQKKPKSPELLPRVPVTTGWLVLVDAGGGPPSGPIEVPPATGIAPIELTLADGRRALAVPCGSGELAAYWAVDAGDRPVCLVVDFDVFTQKDWRAKPT